MSPSLSRKPLLDSILMDDANTSSMTSLQKLEYPGFSRSREQRRKACAIRDYFCSLLHESPTPRARTYANGVCGSSREVTLVGEAGVRCDLSQATSPVANKLNCALQS